jgi:hypothetical protein
MLERLSDSEYDVLIVKLSLVDKLSSSPSSALRLANQNIGTAHNSRSTKTPLMIPTINPIDGPPGFGSPGSPVLGLFGENVVTRTEMATSE